MRMLHLYSQQTPIDKGESPRFVPSRHQQQFSRNMWAVIIHDYFACSNILSHRRANNNCLDSVLHDLPRLLEEALLEGRTLCGTCMMVLNCARCSQSQLWLTERFRRTSFTACTITRFKSCGILTVGTPKARVNTVLLTVRRHFTLAFWMPLRLSATAIFERMKRFNMRRVEECIESRRRDFEHLLQIYFLCITHKLNVSGLMLVWICFLVLLCVQLEHKVHRHF